MLNVFPQVTAFRFFALSRTAKTAKEQPASALFFRVYGRRRPSVSAENEIPLVDNFTTANSENANGVSILEDHAAVDSGEDGILSSTANPLSPRSAAEA